MNRTTKLVIASQLHIRLADDIGHLRIADDIGHKRQTGDIGHLRLADDIGHKRHAGDIGHVRAVDDIGHLRIADDIGHKRPGGDIGHLRIADDIGPLYSDPGHLIPPAADAASIHLESPHVVRRVTVRRLKDGSILLQLEE